MASLHCLDYLLFAKKQKFSAMSATSFAFHQSESSLLETPEDIMMALTEVKWCIMQRTLYKGNSFFKRF